LVDLNPLSSSRGAAQMLLENVLFSFKSFIPLLTVTDDEDHASTFFSSIIFSLRFQNLADRQILNAELAAS